MSALDIVRDETGYKMGLGDETIECSSINECSQYLDAGIKELKTHLWEDWQDLSNLSVVIQNNNAGNSGSLDNIFFLNSVKKAYLLSRMFSDLEPVTERLRALFDSDAIEVHDQLITKFNDKYLEIRLLHYLVMTEIYRTKLLRQYQNIVKESLSVSGPFANLDVPMSERAWPYSEDEEYFDQRTRARREQVRYNPETNDLGYYYVWQDLSRDPYLFSERETESPYKSRNLLAIP